MQHLVLPALLLTLCAGAAIGAPASDPLLERGRYLVRIAGCNDCHTAEYMQKNGEVPERDWLMGSPIGWRGPWGTTYAVNLRLYLEPLSEAQWLTIARNKPARPPMPWYILRDMEDSDLRALYRYIRQLGPGGSPAPSFVPPDQEPGTPYIVMQPQTPGTDTRSQAPLPAADNKPKEKDGSFWDFDFKPAKPRTERP
jgi:mono/diheme cytochrome c family protein